MPGPPAAEDSLPGGLPDGPADGLDDGLDDGLPGGLADGLPVEPGLPLFVSCSGNGDSCPPPLELVLGLSPGEPPEVAGGDDDGEEGGDEAGGCGIEGIELSDSPEHPDNQLEASRHRPKAALRFTG